MKRAVISDLHIGSSTYRAEALLKFLQTNSFDELILAGDIIDFLIIPTFTDNLTKIFAEIGKTESVIYIIGNHDVSLSGLSGHTVFNIKFVKEYEFVDGGKKFRIEHGDKYDTGIVKKDFMMKIISITNDWIHRFFDVDLAHHYYQFREKRRKIKSIWDILKFNLDVDVIIMGHFHNPEKIVWTNENKKTITYVNCGDWVSHQTWVSIDNGEVCLNSFQE